MDFDTCSIVLLSEAPDGPDLTEAEAAALQDAHLDHLAKLHEAGKLLAAGPIRGDGPYIGLSILTVGVDDARALKGRSGRRREAVHIAGAALNGAGRSGHVPARQPVPALGRRGARRLNAGRLTGLG